MVWTSANGPKCPVSPADRGEFMKPSVQEQRCPICDWPMASSAEKGCVTGDCSYRPADPAEQRRISVRRKALSSVSTPAQDATALAKRERFLFKVAEDAYFKAGRTSDPQDWLEAGLFAQQHRNALTALRSTPSASAGPQAEAVDGHGYSGEFTAKEFLKRADEHDKAAANGMSAGPNVSYVRTFQACATALRFAAEHMFSLSTPSASAGPQAEAVWMELLRAAKQMPRATPAPGASCTEHPFTIEAAKVWDLDRAIKAVEAHPQPQQADGRGAVIEALRIALQEIADHPETYNDGKRSYAVGWAFWNVQNIAKAALQQSPATDGPAK